MWTSLKLGLVEALAIFLVAPLLAVIAIVAWRCFDSWDGGN